MWEQDFVYVGTRLCLCGNKTLFMWEQDFVYVETGLCLLFVQEKEGGQTKVEVNILGLDLQNVRQRSRSTF